MSRRTQRWHREIRLWRLCSLYCTRLVCVTNDCRRSNGCHCIVMEKQPMQHQHTLRYKVGGCCQAVQNSKVTMSGSIYLFRDIQWPKSWANIENTEFPLARNLIGRWFADLLRQRRFEEVLLKFRCEKYRIGNVFLVIEKKYYSFR